MWLYTRRIGDDQRGEVLRGLIAIVRCVGDTHLGHAGDLCRLLGDRAAAAEPATRTWISPPIFAAAAVTAC
jgi:hypothetical protein